MMRYALFSLWVSFFSGFFAIGQVDPCSEVAPVAAFVNPFDVTQLHLASVNVSSTEFYGYPFWRVFDEEGTLLAEETLNYFGLVDTTWHVLDVLVPFEFDTESQVVSLELTWNAFAGMETCAFAYEMAPWQPSPNPEAECLSLDVHPWGSSTPGAGFQFTLIHQESGEVVESFDVVADATGVYPYTDIASWCLDLEACYVLEWEPVEGQAGDLPLYLGFSPGDWGTAWFDYLTLVVGPEGAGSALLDAYEPGCDTTTTVDVVHPVRGVLSAWSGANPSSLNVPAPEAWRGAEVMGMQGQILGHISSNGSWPPSASEWVIVRTTRDGVPLVARVFVARD